MNRLGRSLALTALLLSPACTDAPVPAGSSGPDAPTFLSFGANFKTWPISSQVTPLKVSAVLTDPQGVADVIGGSLKSADGSVIGTFATGAEEGAYSATVTWTELAEALPASTFTALNKDLVLTLASEFYDQGGHVATRSLDVTATCADKASSAVYRLEKGSCSYADCEAATHQCWTSATGYVGTDVCRAAFNSTCNYIAYNAGGAQHEPCSGTLGTNDIVYCN